MKKLKIAIYTISLNEEKFVHRFMDTCRGADGVFVADTGSTDKTVELLKSRGAVVNVIKVVPWRFDVARQASMNFVPADYDVLVCIDLDEVLTSNWREEVEKSFLDGNIDRLRYQYVWNHNPDGSDGITFWYDKITTRHGFRWIKPVHEVMEFSGGTERQGYNGNFKLTHHPDPTKSRGSYLPLLELACKEDPLDDRSSHYLGREYMYYGKNEEAIAELRRHLDLPTATWKPERAASMRFLGRCYDRIGKRDEAHEYHLKACAESPVDREPWFELGKHYYTHGDWIGAYFGMQKALEIPERTASYICEPAAWGSEPHDILSVACNNLGRYEEALINAKKALEFEPSNERIQKNIKFLESKIQ